MVHCGGWVTGLLAEDLHEHHNEGYHEDGLLRLLVGLNRKWKRFDNSGLMRVPAGVERRQSDRG